MDASQITKLLQIQNTRYINRSQTVDSSTLTWKNQIQSSKFIKGTPTCDGSAACNIPTDPGCNNNPPNPCCTDGSVKNTGIKAFGGAGRTTAIQSGSPQQFLNVLSGASGSASQVYSSERILLQKAGKESCGVTSPTKPNYPENGYVVLPGGNPSTSNEELLIPSCSYLCLNTNGPTTSQTDGLNTPSVPGNSTITGNPNNLPVNNQSNPYLPPFDTYYRFKNPLSQCKNIPDQNQKHFVEVCHTRFPNANNGVNAVFSPFDNVTELDPITKQFRTANSNPPTCENCIIEPIDESIDVVCPDPVTNFRITNSVTPILGFSIGLEYSWDPVNTGLVTLIPQFSPDEPDTTYHVDIVSNGVGNVYTNTYNYILLLTVTKLHCVPQTATTAPCFLAGSPVRLANGTNIPIEDVKVGDKVLGAFGEINEVLALHRPLLGNNTMTKINNEHDTSSHHPHISVDKKFYAVKPSVAFNGTYGRAHKVIDSNGAIVDRFLSGLHQDRLLTMSLDIMLQTISGPRKITSLETYTMPADTQLYNLVVSGSHTYYVDGYAVTGWPSEDDFDYDTWNAI